MKMPRGGIYECVNCGHREVLDSTEPVIERACPKCGGDMILVGYAVSGVESPNVRSGREEVPAPEGGVEFLPGLKSRENLLTVFPRRSRQG
ncbi:hypothetical protein [Thermococcus sp. JCM 11816]|uniref:hypothetical protein n=1 Tax=Thermococcus sp. (strain JCM 11816 / KS-1) TaxID=1295125 RepID=UPI00373FC8AB